MDADGRRGRFDRTPLRGGELLSLAQLTTRFFEDASRGLPTSSFNIQPANTHDDRSTPPSPGKHPQFRRLIRYTPTRHNLLTSNMSFGGQTPTIIVLKEGKAELWELHSKNLTNQSTRNRSVAGPRTDHLQHQRLFSRSDHHQEHIRPIRRRFATSRRKWQANHHKRWRNSDEAARYRASGRTHSHRYRPLARC